MHRALAICFVSTLLLGLAAPSALADGSMEAEGFRISVPRGFERLSKADRATSLVSRMRLTHGLSVAGVPDVHVFYAGLQASPDALLVAARIGLADPRQLHSRLDQQRYAMDNLRISEQEFDSIVAEGGVDLQPKRVGDYDALQMAHEGSGGALGLLSEPRTRALTVVGSDFLVVVVLLVLDEGAVPVERTWQHVMRSIEIDPRGALVRSMLLYGTVGLVVLILFVFLLRVRAQRKRAQIPSWLNPRAATTSRAWDEDMSAPDLHPVGGPPAAEPEPEPLPDGLGTSLPLPDVAQAAPSAGLKSSLASHRAEHPEAPVAPAPLPLVDEEPEGPPDLTPGSLAPPEPHVVPPSELERPQAPKAAPPARKGLVRTRRPDGRFAE